MKKIKLYLLFLMITALFLFPAMPNVAMASGYLTGTDSPYSFNSTLNPNMNAPAEITYGEDGSASVYLSTHQGIRSTYGLDVSKPIKIEMDFGVNPLSGAYAAGLMALDSDMPLGNGYKFGIAQYLQGIAIADNPNSYPPLQWAGQNNKIMLFSGNKTLGFYSGEDHAAYAQLFNGLLHPTLNASRVASAKYVFLYDIQNSAGNSEATSGSTLTLTVNFADGIIKSVKVPLTVTRNEYPEGKAYFWFNNGDDQAGTRKITLSQPYTLTDGTESIAQITDFNINGTLSDIGTGISVYGNELLTFKVSTAEIGTINVKLGDKVLEQPDSNGVYTIRMQHADSALTVEVGGPEYYDIEFNKLGGTGTISLQKLPEGSYAEKPVVNPVRSGYFFSGWYSDSSCQNPYDFENTQITQDIVLYAGWDKTVILTYTIKGFKDKTLEIVMGETAEVLTIRNFHGASTSNFLEVDSLKLDWYDNAEMTILYDFETPVNEDRIIYGKLTEIKTYAMPNSHGWDEPISDSDDSNNKFMDTYCLPSPVLQQPDGITTFNLQYATMTAIYSRKLDVTKPIYINLNMYAEVGNWFCMSLFDKLTLAQLAYSTGFTGDYGALASWLWNTETGQVHQGLITPWLVNSAYGMSNDWSIEGVIIIDEDPSKSVLKFGDTVISYLNISRSDFYNGYAYISLSTFSTCMFDVMLYQDMEVTTQKPQNGSLTVVREGGAMVAYVIPEEGYELNNLYLNGELVNYYDADDENSYYILFDVYEDAEITADFVLIEEDDENTGDGIAEPTKGCFGSSNALVVFLLVAGTFFAVNKNRRIYLKK